MGQRVEEWERVCVCVCVCVCVWEREREREREGVCWLQDIEETRNLSFLSSKDIEKHLQQVQQTYKDR